MPVDLLVVELAGLLHDLDDAKYRKDRATSSVAAFLASTIGLDTSRADLVQRICENVSYSKERRRLDAGEETEWHRTCFELHCVQDADKLDAMGAIGTLRCAAYSAVIGRPLTLFDEDSVGGQTAIAHFHDKLLRLRGMMRTSEGQRLAESRHRFMLALLEQVALEHKNTLS